MGKFFRLAALLAAVLFVSAPLSAQDVHVSYSGNRVNVFSGVLSSGFTSASGVAYIFSVSPNASVSFYLADLTSGAFTMKYQVFVTGSASVADYSTNKSQWTPAPTYNPAVGFNTSGAQITANFSSPPSMYAVFTPITNSSQIAIVLSGANVGTSTLNLDVVFTPSGTIPLSTVQGFSAENAAASTENPVLIAGKDVSSALVTTLRTASNGLMLVPGQSALNANGQASAVTNAPGSNVTNTIIGAQQFRMMNSAVFTAVRDVDVFHSSAATASGNTAVWTPTAGLKFYFQCLGVDVTGDAKAASAGDLVITLQDGTTAIPGFQWEVAIPTTAGSSGMLYSSPGVCFANGYQSTTANNVLNVNLSFALTGGAVVVRAWGTEH